MMGLGMLTKITRNANSTLKFLKSNSNTFHQRSSIISENSTISPSHLQKICSPNGVVSGFILNPIVGRRFFSNALWKQRRSSIPITKRITTRFYNSFKSLDSGRRSSFKRWFATDGVTISLIVANTAVFLLWRVADTQFMVNNFMISAENFTSNRLHTLITSGFTHHDTFHFVTNMIGLYYFGTSIGRSFGQQQILQLYLHGPIAASLYYLGYGAFIAPSQPFGNILAKDPIQGASGSLDAIVIFGVHVYGATKLKIINPVTKFIIPVPAFLLGIFLIGKDMWRAMEGDPAAFGALGGVTAGAIAWRLLSIGRKRI